MYYSTCIITVSVELQSSGKLLSPDSALQPMCQMNVTGNVVAREDVQELSECCLLFLVILVTISSIETIDNKYHLRDMYIHMILLE